MFGQPEVEHSGLGQQRWGENRVTEDIRVVLVQDKALERKASVLATTSSRETGQNVNACIFVARRRPGWPGSRERAARLGDRLASAQAADLPLAAAQQHRVAAKGPAPPSPPASTTARKPLVSEQPGLLYLVM